MLTQITGLHHVTSLARDAVANNHFFTDVLGQRRVKKTVNFDVPEVYHLYYGDTCGSAGTVITYFPFPDMAARTPGAGEVDRTAYTIPKGSGAAWLDRLAGYGIAGLGQDQLFGETRILLDGPDGEGFALIEAEDERAPWTEAAVPEDMAIRGFHSVSMRLRDSAITGELLEFMGYQMAERSGTVTRYQLANGGPTRVIDIDTTGKAQPAGEGTGSVHHIAFAVDNRAQQLAVREALLDTGYHVTPVRDRQYFHSIYFRSPGGVLFEIATKDPGFSTDEPEDELGTALKLPAQHEYLREKLEEALPQLS